MIYIKGKKKTCEKWKVILLNIKIWNNFSIIQYISIYFNISYSIINIWYTFIKVYYVINSIELNIKFIIMIYYNINL